VSSYEQTNTDQVLSRWKEYFEKHLKESSKEEPHTNQELSRKNEVLNDFPSRDKIVEVIKYLKHNKAASSDSILAELLKKGGPSVVNALNEMIQQVWTQDTT
jgi:hypothetical protein